MAFGSFVVQPDGSAELHKSASRDRFLMFDRDDFAGMPCDRVRLNPAWLMTGYVGEFSLLPSANAERNVIGGVLLGVLGASQQPYAGPVIITGWDSRATYRGEIEVCTLNIALVEALQLLVSDIRKVLGMDDGEPNNRDPQWASQVRLFAEHIRHGEPELPRILTGDEAVAYLRGRRDGAW